MDKAIKQKYKADFATIVELVNSFDPCGLIGGGAPSDEYDCLTQQLLSSVYSNKTRQEMKDLIIHEIEHHFGTPDLATLDEPYKTQFYTDLDKLLNDLDEKFHQNDKSTNT
jgi:hypothetical protein